jgi:predicted dehydrogenase
MYKSLMPDLLSVPSDLPRAIDLAARYGFAGADTGSGVLAAPDFDLEAVKNRFETTGVRPGYMGLAPGRVPVPDTDWRTALEGLPLVAKRAQALGYTRAALVILPFHETLPFNDAFAEHVTRLNEILPILGDHGIALALEYVSPLSRRAALGLEVMRAGKNHLCNKAAFLTLEDLGAARRVQAETKRVFAISYSERLLERIASRPAWFFERKHYDGILIDIGSHQIEQFLYYSDLTDVEVVSSQVANYKHPDHGEFEDYGEATFRGQNAGGDIGTCFVRADWLIPDNASHTGRHRVVLGTEGILEIGGETLTPTNGGGTERIDCSSDPVLFGTRLVDDVPEPHRDRYRSGALFLHLGIDASRTASGGARGQSHRLNSTLAHLRRQNMEPLRFGIVGCGVISGTHGKALQRLQEEGLATLVAAADQDKARAEKFTGEFGGAACGSLDQLLARDDIDAVTICTPSGMHGRMAVQAAKAGKHVLSEKPLDVWIDAVDEAIAATTAAGVVYGGIFQERFTADAQKLKRAVDSGAFGEIVLACAETKWYRGQDYYNSGSWRGTWELDAGVFSNQGIHSLDKVQWLAGEVVEVLSATVRPGFHRSIEGETLGGGDRALRHRGARNHNYDDTRLQRLPGARRCLRHDRFRDAGRRSSGAFHDKRAFRGGQPGDRRHRR